LKIKLFGASTNQLTIGSDEEKDLVNAIKSTFPEAGHFLCMRHLCMCTVGTIYHKRIGSIKINMAEIKGCNSCIYQSTKNPPIDGVYFYPHTNFGNI
jgi:transposase-like protein